MTTQVKSRRKLRNIDTKIREVETSDTDTETSDTESEEEIDDLPSLPSKRTKGKKYMYNGEVRIWGGKTLFCRHRKIPCTCNLCSDPKFFCEECDLHFMRKENYEKHLNFENYLLSKEELKTVRIARGKNATEIGDAVEIYILSKLKQNSSLEFVERIGHTGNKFDTILKFNNEICIRGIQVKNLRKFKGSLNAYEFSNDSSYEDDTLIVAANVKDQVFCIVPFSIVANLSGPYFSPDGKLGHYMYHNEEKFLKELFDQLKTTTILRDNDLTNYFTENQKLEYFSQERLLKICETKNLVFRKNDTNGNETDCFINDIPIQCKSSTFRGDYHAYTFHLHKRNGSNAIQPYNINDNIDFFIFNIAVPEFENRFYIIPKSVMVDRGFLKSDNHKGIKFTHMASPNSLKPHWSLEFLDNFSLLTRKSLDPLMGKCTFEKICIEKGLEYKKAINHNKGMLISSINGKQVRFIDSGEKKDEKDTYQVLFKRWDSGKKYIVFKATDNIDIFIVSLKALPGNFCIIPRSVLLDRNFLVIENKGGRKRLQIIDINSQGIHWSMDFWNNFSAFL
jgi:hypothetical protein